MAEPSAPAAPAAASPDKADALWYKDAVVYELHVRSFFDSNDDGIGDFAGLTGKLDYIQELGVNTVWLLPFYPSPLRDDGYDIADYRGINPQYGSRSEFRQFIREAHRRGLRVITELVVNHTSVDHPWFQAARRAAPGSSKRDFYVWSDDPKKYTGTRVIFTDTEESNWAWDKVAGAYYWHRFFSHQPDLNFANPRVVRAIMRAMRYWLDEGVDGLRLDAVPYLCEREGTNNENLRETHLVVQEFRRVIDAHYSDRMLLAEANQWPEDARDYFGDGNECHMAYHFPLMPRMYMAIAQEDRYPIVEILEQTPDIPANCQWAIFLRNHDELTLEMVTSRERDYMYRTYAADARARLNLGIRRRLAPLMENDHDRIKLMNSLLLSMPGSPILYYGDEIGMGDNFFLGDRNGVRTPMQWSPDRNAGFSRADPQRLFLPPIMDPIYGYEAVNVEAQTRDRSSLLNWTRRLLAVRKTSKAFGRGLLQFLKPGNRKVLAYLRSYEDDTMLCVANLSRSAQPVELDLASLKGHVPIELLGRTAFPPIGDLPYLLTLPHYGFYWFRLSKDIEPPSWHAARLAREELPLLVLFDGWNSFFRERVVPWRMGLAEKLRQQLERQALPQFLAAQRWWPGRDAGAVSASIDDHGFAITTRGATLLALLKAEGGMTESERVFLPLVLAWEDERTDAAQHGHLAGAAVARVRQQAAVGILADAFADDAFCQLILETIGGGREIALEHGRLRGVPTRAFAERRGDPTKPLLAGAPAADAGHTTLALGDRLFLKVCRRAQPGTSPEFEFERYLTEVAQFANCVPLAGALEYLAASGECSTLALLQGFVRNQGDAWVRTTEYLKRFLEETRPAAEVTDPDVHADYLHLVRTLATRTAQLHLALAAAAGDPLFDPEPVVATDLTQWHLAAEREVVAALQLLEQQFEQLPAGARTDARLLAQQREQLLQQLRNCRPATPQGAKIRLHGDYRLQQILLVGDDLVIDFERDATGPGEDRRRKHSPWRDVAAMLRSFDQARAAALHDAGHAIGEPPSAEAGVLLSAWLERSSAVFLETYRSGMQGAAVLGAADDGSALLRLFGLELLFRDLRCQVADRSPLIGAELRNAVSLCGAAGAGR
jgi:maltose alpha-D-glucosyltransferase/alpha-amylase